MDRDRVVYYIAFPLVTALLCAFSYYLGLRRGEQKTVEVATHEEPKEVKLSKPKDFTFYETLRGADQTSPSKSKTAKQEKESTALAPIVTEQKKSRGTLAVQISAFRDVGKAHELIDNLKNRGYEAFLNSGWLKKDGWHRVYVGPYGSKTTADEASISLERDGFGRGFVTNLRKR